MAKVQFTNNFSKPLHETGLNQLREEMKNVMLPLLVRVFEQKQALKTDPHAEKIRAELIILQDDFQLLSRWCQTSQHQIARALKDLEAPSERRKEKSWFEKISEAFKKATQL